MHKHSFLATRLMLLILAAAGPVQAAVVVYDNLNTTAVAAVSEPNAHNPIFGDSVTLAQAGTLVSVGLSLQNPSSGGNTGTIDTGSTLVRFYDNTVPYSGGAISNPLLGTASISWDFTGEGGMPPGFYETTVVDVSGLGISVPRNLLVTQQFTQTSGTSTGNGVVLFSDSTLGTSPNTMYRNSTATAEGLYTTASGQVGYEFQIVAVPEPGACGVVLSAVAAATVGLLRWRRVGEAAASRIGL